MRNETREVEQGSNEGLRLRLAAGLALAALAAFVWGGVEGAAAHYVGGLLVILAGSIGGYKALSSRVLGATFDAGRVHRVDDDPP